MLDQIRTALEADSAQHARTGQAIWSNALPVGAASTVSSRPYLLSLAQRTAGLLPAVISSEEVYRLEMQTAAAALDSPVAVETSAVYVAAAVLGCWPSVGPEFSELLLAAPAERDILLSQAIARSLTNVTGALTLAPGSGQLRFSELTNDARAAIVNHCATVHDAAQSCRIVSVDNLDSVGGGQQVRLVGAWVAPLAVAVEHQLPLYSDDVVLRAMARVKGVPAFGTLALLDVLITTGRMQPGNPDSVLPTLFDHHVVDLPHTAQLVLDTANQHGPLVAPVLLNLARPAMWQSCIDDAIGIVVALAADINAIDNPHGLASFVAACTTGWAAAFSPPEVAIANVAAAILAYNTGITVDAARIVIPVIRAVGAMYDIDPLPNLRTYLIGVLTDATDRFQRTDEQAAETVDAALCEFI